MKTPDEHANILDPAREVLVRLSGRLQISDLAEVMGIPASRLESYKLGRAPFPARHLAALYRGVLEITEDRSLALWAFEAASGIRAIGHRASPLPLGTDGDPVAVDLMQGTAAIGAAHGLLAGFGSEIDSQEAARILPVIREARVQLSEAETKCALLAEASNQRRLMFAEVRA